MHGPSAGQHSSVVAGPYAPPAWSKLHDCDCGVQGGHKLMGARNWCLVEELLYSEQPQPGLGDREALRQQKASGALLYTLRVEDPANQTAQPTAYEAICPLYIYKPLGESPPVPDIQAVLDKWDVASSQHRSAVAYRQPRGHMLPGQQFFLGLKPNPSCGQDTSTCPRMRQPARLCVYAGSHMAVRRSSLLQSCMCLPKTKEDDPLDEL